MRALNNQFGTDDLRLVYRSPMGALQAWVMKRIEEHQLIAALAVPVFSENVGPLDAAIQVWEGATAPLAVFIQTPMRTRLRDRTWRCAIEILVGEEVELNRNDRNPSPVTAMQLAELCAAAIDRQGFESEGWSEVQVDEISMQVQKPRLIWRVRATSEAILDLREATTE